VLSDAQARKGRPWLTAPWTVRASAFSVSLVLFALLSWHARTVVDDAFINFRIVDNLLAGYGPVYNLGERVEAGTSPAWLAVLALLAVALGPLGVPLPLISVVAGIVAGVGGLACAQATTMVTWRRIRAQDPRWPSLLVPAGSLVVLALPPFWEFTASGLETGLALLWIGGSALAVATGDEARTRWGWRAVVVGLGPLVRPDLAVIAGPLLLALLTAGPARLGVWMRTLAWALALPLALQVLRMGYFAALVPNTALAKEAFEAFWARGLVYLWDLLDPYWLVVALLPLTVMALRLMAGSTPGAPRATAAALVAGAVLHAAYVVRVGGDFMHGRMLLPALFAFVTPAALWPVTTRRRSAAFSRVAQAVVLVLMVAWAVVSGMFLRVPYRGEVGPAGIADELAFYRGWAGHPNPVVPDDYRGWQGGPVAVGERLRARAETGPRALLFDAEEWPLVEGPPVTVVTDGVMIGLAAYVAGPRVHMADTLGLTDPIAARLQLDERGRAGHEKWRLRDWMAGRFIAPDHLEEATGRYPQAGEARRALSCGSAQALLEAVTAPLTVSRFVANVAAAPGFTRLRLAGQPVAAAAGCGG
jgi:arabinofuranosyltransferase